MLWSLQRKFHISAIALESKVKVKYGLKIAMKVPDHCYDLGV